MHREVSIHQEVLCPGVFPFPLHESTEFMVCSGRIPSLKTIASLGVGALLLGGLMLDGRAQEPEQPTIQKAMRSSQLLGDWLGTWRGTVRNHLPDGVPNEFEMELTIAPTDSPNELQSTNSVRVLSDRQSVESIASLER